MRAHTVGVLYLLTAIFLIVAVGVQVFVDEYLKIQTLFASLLAATILSTLLTLKVNTDVPL